MIQIIVYTNLETRNVYRAPSSLTVNLINSL